MAFPKFVSFWVGFLVFLWPKVTNNHGVPEIRVFLGWIFGVSLAQMTNNYGVPKIRVFLGQIFGISLAQLTNNYGIPKIHFFLHPEMLEF